MIISLHTTCVLIIGWQAFGIFVIIIRCRLWNVSLTYFDMEKKMPVCVQLDSSSLQPKVVTMKDWSLCQEERQKDKRWDLCQMILFPCYLTHRSQDFVWFACQFFCLFEYVFAFVHTGYSFHTWCVFLALLGESWILTLTWTQKLFRTGDILFHQHI